MLIVGDDCFIVRPCRILKVNWFHRCCCRLLILLSFQNNAWENEDSGFINTQTNTLYDTKSKDQCLLQLPLQSYKEKHKHAGTSGDQTWICLESSSTQTSPHTCTHKHMLTRKYTYHCSALFSLKTSSFERTGVVCFNVCVFVSASVGTVYVHTHMLLSVHFSPASNLIRSTAGLWLCHIYIQMEI